MSILKSMSKKARAMRKRDSILYEVVANEIAGDNIIAGIRAKALEKAGGDFAKANAFYIKFRVEQLKDEIHDAADLEHTKNSYNQSRERGSSQRPNNIKFKATVSEESLRNISGALGRLNTDMQGLNNPECREIIETLAGQGYRLINCDPGWELYQDKENKVRMSSIMNVCDYLKVSN